MSQQILQSIYNFTKNYKDTINNKPLDENNDNFQVAVNNENVRITINIDPKRTLESNKLSNLIESHIKKIKGISKVDIVLTAEKKPGSSNQNNSRFQY